MNNTTQVITNQEVKSLNIYDLLNEYSGGVLIPKIQRDYAQGRDKSSDSGQAELVRNSFLNYLFDNHSSPKSLDFVFGTCKVKEKKQWFIPVDGQQRITTLWLLMLYKEKLIKDEVNQDILKKFSYDTRRAARDFVKQVAEKEWCIVENRNKSDDISYSLKISNWFMDYWQYDPTVDSMLRMLDTIHNLYKEKKSFPDLAQISFYFFDMQAHGLDENLYLKMNSRGKPLTPFENLKANIESLLEEKNDASSFIISADVNVFSGEKETDKNLSGDTFVDKWKYHLDRDWTNWFWKNSRENNTIDNAFVQFICRFIAGYCLINETCDTEKEKEIIDYLLKCDDGQNIDFEKIKPTLTAKAFEAIAKVLMDFSKDKDIIKPYWDKDDKFNGSDKIKIEEYKQLAVIQTYVIADGRDDKKAWLRFAWNMAENYVDGAGTYKTYCERLAELKDEAYLYSTLSHRNDTEPVQFKEEIYKAKQIIEGQLRKDGKLWEDVIIEAESYTFFKGDIRFLFIDEKGEVNENSWEQFDKKWENAKKYFKESCDDKVQSVLNDEYDNANLLKALISNFNDDNFEAVLCWRHRVFNNKIETWRYYLLNREICSAVYKLLMGQNKIKEREKNSGNVASERLWQLSNTDLLDYVIKNIPNSWIRWYHNHMAIFPSAQGVFLNADKRNRFLLHTEGITINNEAVVPNTDFLFGSDIDFEYKYKTNTYLMNWYRNDYIYLKEKGDYKIRNTDGKTEEEKYYCFPIGNMSDDDIIKAMKDLIEEANSISDSENQK